MRLLVCGGREFDDKAALFAVLDTMHSVSPVTVLIHGQCFTPIETIDTARIIGADWFADQWAMVNEIERLPFPADWKRLKRPAGPIRNGQMLTEGKPDLVLAFKGHKGTSDMVRQARRAGVKVLHVVGTEVRT